MSKCDIVIPVWNQPKETKICLDSIIRNTGFPYNLLIIDNASQDRTKKIIEEFKESHPELNIKIVNNETNEGFIKAVNKGISISREKYISILNNDTVVTEGWLSEMARILDENPKIGIVNPSSNNLGQKKPRNTSLDKFASLFKKDSGKYGENMYCIGFCMLFRRSLIDEIGLFDEIYGMGNFEDTDFSMKAKKIGYLCVRSFGSYVYHKEGSSFKFFKHRDRMFENNKNIFESRWGKQKRILFILNMDKIKDEYIEKMNNHIKENNWVYIAARKNNELQKKQIPCFNHYYYKDMLNIKILLKILFKKKKFDYIYCGNNKLFRIIKFLKPVHKANLLIL